MTDGQGEGEHTLKVYWEQTNNKGEGKGTIHHLKHIPVMSNFIYKVVNDAQCPKGLKNCGCDVL